MYNLESFMSFKDSAKATGFTDSSAGTVLEQNLNHIDPTILETKYSGLTFLQQGIVGDNSGGYAATVTSLRIDIEGDFKVSGDNSDNKGNITISADDSLIRVIGFEADSRWTETEIKTAELQGINLPSRLIGAHNMLYNRRVDKIGYLGTLDASGAQATPGLLNYTGFTVVPATGAISTLTGEQMYSEFQALITSQWAAANGVDEFKANRVVTSDTILEILASTILNSAASPDSVLVALQKNFAGVSFGSTTKARDAGLAGASRTVAFNNSGDAMKFRIPVPFHMSPIFQQNFTFTVATSFRIAGLDILEDISARYLEGL